MFKVGVLSDTHSYLHPKVFKFFEGCNEIWHAGDIGSHQLIKELEDFKKTRAVYGNIDSHKLRQDFPLIYIFYIEEVKVFMTHILGRPGKYQKDVLEKIIEEKPGLVICGHSHICRIEYDNKYNFLYLNPGAAGKYGLHQLITLLRFSITGKEIRDMEILELDK